MPFPSNKTLDHLRQVVQLPDLSGTCYRLGNELGRGGMAVVYEAWDTKLERLIALKVVNTGYRASENGTRELEEAKTLARLEHPGIVPIYDVGQLADGRIYYAMKLVRGRPLDDFLTHEPGLVERIRVFQKVCDAVSYAHNCGAVHRDLRPENVMVGSFGEVFVIDWGVAEWLLCSGETRRQSSAGTPRYMAPEQLGERSEPVDGRADIFSLGAILQDVLRDESSRPVAAITKKALSPDPSERYGTVEELASDLRRFLERLPITAYNENVLERLSHFAGRHRILLLCLATYALVRVAIFLLDHR